MKKLTALVLCLLLCAAALTACVQQADFGGGPKQDVEGETQSDGGEPAAQSGFDEDAFWDSAAGWWLSCDDHVFFVELTRPGTGAGELTTGYLWSEYTGSGTLTLPQQLSDTAVSFTYDYQYVADEDENGMVFASDSAAVVIDTGAPADGRLSVTLGGETIKFEYAGANIDSAMELALTYQP